MKIATAAELRDAWMDGTGATHDPVHLRNLALNIAKEWRANAGQILSSAEGEMKASEARKYQTYNKNAEELELMAAELAEPAAEYTRRDKELDDKSRELGINGFDRSPRHPQVRSRPAFIREATRKMNDEEVFLRDFAKGREGSEVEFDFSGLAHGINDHGQTVVWNVDRSTGSSGLVFTDIASRLYEHLIETNKVFGLATVENTADGNSIKFPKTTAGGTAQIVSEGSAIPDSEGSFGSVTLDAFKYAHWITASNEILEDVSFDLAGYIARDAGRAIGLASGAHMATGSGASQPRGIVTAVANDVGTAVAIGSATVEATNIIDAFYAVSTPYRENAVWLMNSSTAKAIRKLKDADDRFVWSSGLSEQPDTILGRPVVIDPAIASIGSANLSVYFGDINQTYLARTGGVKLMRSDHYLAKNDQVAFRATARMDSDLIDSTSDSAALVDTD